MRISEPCTACSASGVRCGAVCWRCFGVGYVDLWSERTDSGGEGAGQKGGAEQGCEAGRADAEADWASWQQVLPERGK